MAHLLMSAGRGRAMGGNRLPPTTVTCTARTGGSALTGMKGPATSGSAIHGHSTVRIIMACTAAVIWTALCGTVQPARHGTAQPGALWASIMSIAALATGTAPT